MEQPNEQSDIRRRIVVTAAMAAAGAAVLAAQDEPPARAGAATASTSTAPAARAAVPISDVRRDFMTSQVVRGPATAPFVQPLHIPPVKQQESRLSPKPTEAAGVGEAGRLPHPAWAPYPPRRFYLVHADMDQNFVQIANDGNLLPAPLTMNKLRLAVAERGDIVIDFAQFPLGSKVYLVNRLEHLDGRDPTGNLLTPGTPILRPLAAPVVPKYPTVRQWYFDRENDLR